MIVFFTDFGLSDGYVGVVESVIAARAPSVRVIHLAHEIAPQDLRAGAYVLWSALPHLVAGSVVLGVVDPGVGSARRAIAVRGSRFSYVGPDNGLFAPAWHHDAPIEACALTRDPSLRARTFDGRDLFGPAAAALASGATLESIGTSIDPSTLVRAAASPTRDLVGEIWTFDRYGNAITTLAADFDAAGTIATGAHRFALATHFASVGLGEPVAFVGSSGLVEIAIRDGSARDALNLEVGDRVSRAT